MVEEVGQRELGSSPIYLPCDCYNSEVHLSSATWHLKETAMYKQSSFQSVLRVPDEPPLLLSTIRPALLKA